MTRTARPDIYQTITAKIVAAVEASLRIPAKATTHSDAWRPPIPVDGDQVARVRGGAVGCMS